MILSDSNFIRRESCPVCDSRDFRTLYSERFDAVPVREYLEIFYSESGRSAKATCPIDFDCFGDSEYTLVECEVCELIYQLEIFNDHFMKVLYEKWIDPNAAFELHHRARGLNYYRRCSEEVSTIVDFIGKRPADISILDFGMGWGAWALMAKGFGCRSYGSELSKDRIDYARAKGIDIVDWASIPEHQFDFINTEQVFEHIAKPLETLKHLGRGLSESGVVKISVPTALGIRRRLRRMDFGAPKGSRNSLNAVAPLEHINFFRRSSLLRLGRLAGLEQVTVPLTQQYRNLSNWGGPVRAIRNLVKPVVLNYTGYRNYIFLQKRAHRSDESSTGFS